MIPFFNKSKLFNKISEIFIGMYANLGGNDVVLLIIGCVLFLPFPTLAIATCVLSLVPDRWLSVVYIINFPLFIMQLPLLPTQSCVVLSAI